MYRTHRPCFSDSRLLWPCGYVRYVGVSGACVCEFRRMKGRPAPCVRCASPHGCPLAEAKVLSSSVYSRRSSPPRFPFHFQEDQINAIPHSPTNPTPTRTRGHIWPYSHREIKCYRWGGVSQRLAYSRLPQATGLCRSGAGFYFYETVSLETVKWIQRRRTGIEDRRCAELRNAAAEAAAPIDNLALRRTL